MYLEEKKIILSQKLFSIFDKVNRQVLLNPSINFGKRVFEQEQNKRELKYLNDNTLDEVSELELS